MVYAQVKKIAKKGLLNFVLFFVEFPLKLLFQFNCGILRIDFTKFHNLKLDF